MRGTQYPMVVMAMDIKNITAKSLAEQAGMSLSSFQNKMRGYVKNIKGISFTLPECYRILQLLEIPCEQIFTYFPPKIETAHSHRRVPQMMEYRR